MTTRGRPKIVIAEDHALVRFGIEKILERDYDVIGTVSDGRELVHAVVVLKPAIAIVDIGLPVMNGIEATREIVKEKLDTRVVFVSMHTEPDYVVGALRAGGRAYVPKHAPPGELLIAIRNVLFGRTYISPLISGDIITRMRHRDQRDDLLTARQRQVVQMVAEGIPSRRIAELLKISVKTVEFHRAKIMERLGIHSTVELTRYAIQTGLVTIPGPLHNSAPSGSAASE